MSSKIIVLNGPNLNMLGIRQPEIYGTQTLDEIRDVCNECAASLHLKLDFRQSNHEGQLIEWVQEAASSDAAGLVINPAGSGYNSIALLDALMMLKLPVIEVHLSNIHKRESFRRHTHTSSAAQGVIAGFGGYGYLLALYALADIIKKPKAS